jgi:hypothetical protein
MITTRIAAAIAAGALSVGILAGSAGAIVLREAMAPRTVDWTAHISQMGSMSSMMGGQSWMQQHHGAVAPGPTR